MEKDLLGQVYEKYYMEIYRFLLAMSSDPESAKDLTQETFYRALMTLNDGHPNVRAWLYTVARNLCINQLKREKHRSLEDIPDDLVCPAKSPEDQLLYTLKRQKLKHSMEKLSVTQRKILKMYYFDSVPINNIAEITGLGSGNVRVILCRTRMLLKKMMEEDVDEIQ